MYIYIYTCCKYARWSTFMLGFWCSLHVWTFFLRGKKQDRSWINMVDWTQNAWRAFEHKLCLVLWTVAKTSTRWWMVNIPWSKGFQHVSTSFKHPRWCMYFHKPYCDAANHSHATQEVKWAKQRAAPWLLHELHTFLYPEQTSSAMHMHKWICTLCMKTLSLMQSVSDRRYDACSSHIIYCFYQVLWNIQQIMYMYSTS